MDAVADRSDVPESRRADAPGERPVVLGTLSVRIHPAAEDMAIGGALEAGLPLTVANAVLLPPYPATIALHGPHAATLPGEEDLDAVRGTAHRAAAMGIATCHLRIVTLRPVRALLEVVAEQKASLFVFGPDPARLGERRFRRAARVVRQRAPCLLWIVTDG